MPSNLFISFYGRRTFPKIHAFQDCIFSVAVLDTQDRFLQLVLFLQGLLLLFSLLLLCFNIIKQAVLHHFFLHFALWNYMIRRDAHSPHLQFRINDPVVE